MQLTATIPIKNIPDAFARQVHGYIRNFSVTMLAANKSQRDAVPCAGTLVSLCGKKGILTAHHVWKCVESKDLLILMAGKSIECESKYLHAIVPIARGSLPDVGATVPDIAFIELPLEICNTLEAYGKVFYSIERRANDPEINLYSHLGYWAIVGSPQALLDEENGRVASFIYDTGVQRRVEFEGWDYLYVNLDILDNSQIPRDYGGMSGGGIWRVEYATDPELRTFVVESNARGIVLSGVIFYQTAEDGRQLLSHGPQSIYRAFIDGCCGK